MLKQTYTPLLLLLAVTLLAGCTGSQQVAQAPHPAAGAWDFSVDTPQGVFNGVLTLTEAEDVLNGTIAFETQPGDVPVDKVMFDGSELSFDFDSGEYGVMNVKVNVEGDAFNGNLTLASMGASMPMAGTRKTE